MPADNKSMLDVEALSRWLSSEAATNTLAQPPLATANRGAAEAWLAAVHGISPVQGRRIQQPLPLPFPRHVGIFVIILLAASSLLPSPLMQQSSLDERQGRQQQFVLGRIHLTRSLPLPSQFAGWRR